MNSCGKHMNESCHTQVWISHVTHRYEWVMSHTGMRPISVTVFHCVHRTHPLVFKVLVTMLSKDGGRQRERERERQRKRERERESSRSWWLWSAKTEIQKETGEKERDTEAGREIEKWRRRERVLKVLISMLRKDGGTCSFSPSRALSHLPVRSLSLSLSHSCFFSLCRSLSLSLSLLLTHAWMHSSFLCSHLTCLLVACKTTVYANP